MPVSTTTASPSVLSGSSAQLAESSNAPTISFPDPRVRKERPLDLHYSHLLSRKITHCRGECGENITAKTHLLVKSFGDTSFYDAKSGKQVQKKGALYIHFDGNCLKDFDSLQTGNVYRPSDEFPYEKIVLDPISKQQMPTHEVDFLKNMGIRV